MRSSAATVALPAFAAVALLACVPQLNAIDGYYGCADGVTCPTQAPYCHADLRCYVAPADGGRADSGNGPEAAPGTDAMTGPDAVADAPGRVEAAVDAPTGPYGACDAGRCPAGQTCIGGAYCAPNCSTGTVCPQYRGQAGVCSGGACLMPCSGGAGDCLPGVMCAIGRWNDSSGSTWACADAARILPARHGATCSSSAQCDAPDTCVAGACVRTCTSDMSPCGADEGCGGIPPSVSGTSGILGCFTPCGSGTCADTDFACRTPMGRTPGLCFPSGWIIR